MTVFGAATASEQKSQYSRNNNGEKMSRPHINGLWADRLIEGITPTIATIVNNPLLIHTPHLQ